jgi:hypothetical protein
MVTLKKQEQLIKYLLNSSLLQAIHEKLVKGSKRIAKQ